MLARLVWELGQTMYFSSSWPVVAALRVCHDIVQLHLFGYVCLSSESPTAIIDYALNDFQFQKSNDFITGKVRLLLNKTFQKL